MALLLVTNDFPPKLGGIQSYLWELVRRVPNVTVLTARSAPTVECRAFDEAQPFRVVRHDARVLLPSRTLVATVDGLAREIAADAVIVDPVLPLGLVAPALTAAPVWAVVHGAELTTPGRLPGARQLAQRVLHAVEGVIAAGGYPARIATEVAGRPLRRVVIPPGVDTDRFRPGGGDRSQFGLPAQVPLVLGISRLVPRKGFDVVIDAVIRSDSWHLAIAGDGRDGPRLLRRARPIADRVHFLGRIPDDALPSLYASADVFSMACRDRWFGLEAEGFGIVFLEAQATGLPVVAGRSGGSHEAVADAETGFVVDPRDVGAVHDAIARAFAHRERLGAAARRRMEAEYTWDELARRLREVPWSSATSVVPEPHRTEPHRPQPEGLP